MISLSVLILSYNTKVLLEQCLASVFRYLPKGKFEVIVVDNASSDGSPEMVKKMFPEVNLIISEENLGFAKGMNLGAKTAQGQCLLLLNSDAELTDNSVMEMMEYLEDHSSVGIVGGVLKNPDGSRQRSYGPFYTLPAAVRMLLFGDKGEVGNESITHPKVVDWVSGGFMLIRKELFLGTNGFDERFFMYMEDMEFCYRIKKGGDAIYFFPGASVIHKGQGSSNRAFAIKQIYKGLLYFYKKHRSPLEYTLMKTILTTKAKVLIFLGRLTHNTYLQTTYRQALQA